MPLDTVVREYPRLCAILALLPMLVIWATVRLLYVDYGVPGSLALFGGVFGEFVIEPEALISNWRGVI
ncbi:hypothetical protein DACRYDRAFT_108672 [Dacryopinax primogenitus]|uniref:Uncharacterized protein n=1 Tax=Dacryopinax primogenitus (strain DJM 731) TaxID=1858805 RepID=M5FSW5_DACPD|nr:uncharacterized protein DACRYDRAFT_108672 [Dacryopinax primogenitus]EJU00606.1 hypothetical protein DACRYDRAFT_108672 [Dacryopinax primogenitus]